MYLGETHLNYVLDVLNKAYQKDWHVSKELVCSCKRRGEEIQDIAEKILKRITKE